MNSFVISVGGYIPNLSEKALQMSVKVGQAALDTIKETARLGKL